MVLKCMMFQWENRQTNITIETMNDEGILMVEIEELGIEREDKLPDIFKKARERRGLFLFTATHSKNEVAQAIYHLSAEVCELEKLLAQIIPMFSK